MTKKKELDELTDKAAIRKLFPKEVVREAKRVAKESAERAEKRAKPKDSETSA